MNSSLLLYNKHNIEQIKQICLPLSTYLGIDNYGYIKIYKNSQYFYLSNNLIITEDYLNYVKTSTFPTGKLLNYFANEYRILWLDGFSGYEADLGAKYNIFNMLYVFKESSEYLEAWWFSPTGYDPAMKSFCKKNIPIFLTFINHFNYESYNLLLNEDNHLASFDNGYNFDPINALEYNFLKGNRVSKQNLDSFMQSMLNKGFPVKRHNQLLKLTVAELNCMQLLSKYNTAKEIANRLSISHRTVESHLYNIKRKLGYSSKSDIISYFQDNISCLVPEDLYKLGNSFSAKSD